MDNLLNMTLFQNNATELKINAVFILNIDLTVWNIEDGNQTNTEHYWFIDCILHYFIIMEQSLREIFPGGVMALKLG